MHQALRMRQRDPKGIFSRKSGKLPGYIQQSALIKLRMISNAQKTHDLRIPPANLLYVESNVLGYNSVMHFSGRNLLAFDDIEKQRIG